MLVLRSDGRSTTYREAVSSKELYVKLIRNLQSGAAAWNGMWDVIGKRQEGAMSEDKYDAWMTKCGGEAGTARENIRDCFALANIVSPRLADLLDRMWTEADEVTSSDRSLLRARAEIYDKTLAAVIKEGRAAFEVPSSA